MKRLRGCPQSDKRLGGLSAIRVSDAPDFEPGDPRNEDRGLSMTPLGCLTRRTKRDLRQILLLGAEASNCFRDLGFCHARQIIRRRLQAARELPLPPGSLSSTWQILIDGRQWKLFIQFLRQLPEGNPQLD